MLDGRIDGFQYHCVFVQDPRTSLHGFLAIEWVFEVDYKHVIIKDFQIKAFYRSEKPNHVSPDIVLG